jgi:hypothetical protein
VTLVNLVRPVRPVVLVHHLLICVNYVPEPKRKKFFGCVGYPTFSRESAAAICRAVCLKWVRCRVAAFVFLAFKQRYEELALEFAQNAGDERDLNITTPSLSAINPKFF